MSFMVVWFGPAQRNLRWIESVNCKNDAFGLLLTQNSLSNAGPRFSD